MTNIDAFLSASHPGCRVHIFNSFGLQGYKMNDEPYVTIGLVTYNRPDMLKEAVHSILRQTYKNFRLIIGNDYIAIPVTFQSLEIEPDPRITIINNEENMGEIDNLNYVLNQTVSEWFSWLCDDDVFHPDFLKNMIDAVEKVPDICVSAVFTGFASGCQILDAFYGPLENYSVEIYTQDRFLVNYLNRKITLVGCYGLISTKALKEMSGMILLGNGYGPYSDTILPILLTQSGDIIWLNSQQVFLRTHQNSLSASSAEFDAFTSAEVDFLNHLERVCLLKTKKENFGYYSALLIRWFIDNELIVLLRNKSDGLIWSLIKFGSYQLRVNLPRLEKKYWFGTSIYVIRVSVNQSVLYCKNLVRQKLVK